LAKKMNPEDRATLHLRGNGTRVGDCIARGAMIEMVDRVMRETPENRRLLVIMCGDMQYRAAEIENLAGRDDFGSLRDRSDGASAPVKLKRPRAYPIRASSFDAS
jgi:hypothetical protein